MRVAIVGAGAVGLACADHLLAREGVEVVVLEQDQVASGSSGLNIGIVETQYVDRMAIELRVYARRFFDRLAADDGLELHRCGYLRPAYDPSSLARFHQSVAIQRELGVLDARVLDPEEIGRLAPDLRHDDMAGALFGPSDGYVDPHRYCALLADRVRERGGELRTRARLVGADRDGGGVRLRTADGGTVAADVVVNAAGAWASAVGELLGAPVTVIPQRRSAAIAHLDAPLSYVMPFVMNYTPGEGRPGAYVRHERDDQLVVGTHSEEAVDPPADPDRYPRGVTQEFLEDLAEQLASRLPTLAQRMSIGQGWSGLYPVSPSGPRVGPRPDAPGVVDAVGFGGSGLQASPTAGLLVAEWLLDGEPKTIPGARALAPTA